MTIDRSQSPATEYPLIALENLGLSFRKSWNWRRQKPIKVLDNINLTIQQGEIVGIVGESGCGKTTLGKAMLRLYEPKGRIIYRGNDLALLKESALRPYRRDLQMVFQDPLSSFNPRFRIASSVALPLMLHQVAKNSGEAYRLVDTTLRQVGLNTEIKWRYPHELSGGQLQRVAIARALGIGPKLIVADEAVSKLDVSVRAQVLNLIKAVNHTHGVAFVFITHDLAVAKFLCDRIAVMYTGRIVELGTTTEIFGNPQHPYSRRLINARQNEQGGLDIDNAEISQ
jgi:oligopeptide transport system ATP-binding protein